MDKIRWEVIEGRVEFSHGLEFRSRIFSSATIKSAKKITNAKISFNAILDSYNIDKNMIFTISLDNNQENKHINILFYSDRNIEIYESNAKDNKRLASLINNEERKSYGLTIEDMQINSFTGEDFDIEIYIFGSVISIYRNSVEILNANKVGTYSAQVNANFEGNGLAMIKNFSVKDMKMQAFIVMDFSEQYRQIYLNVIKPACDNNNLICSRADELEHPGKITSDILKKIREADVIIAEVTPNNANVYIEIGYALAFNKRIIPLAENTRKELPFDIHDVRAIFYENTESGIETVRNKLSNFLSSINGEDSSSLYSSILLNENERK